jgi:hypothetical protein
MIDRFKKYIDTLVEQSCDIKMLQARPVAGAVLWAYELLHGDIPFNIKEKVILKVGKELD